MLKDVQILETWHQIDGAQYYVLAGLNRAKTEHRLREEILVYDQAINQHIQDARYGTDVLTNLRSLKRALRDLGHRQALNIDLQIVQLTGEGIPTSNTKDKIQQELNDYLLNKVGVQLRIKGDQKKQIERAVWDGLHQEGLVTFYDDQNDVVQEDSTLFTDTGRPDLLITGETTLGDLKLYDPLFKYVRWCTDLRIIITKTQQIIGVVSRSGREGHITFQEARVRATRAMQKITSTEIAKSLARYIYSDDYKESPSPPSSCLTPH